MSKIKGILSFKEIKELTHRCEELATGQAQPTKAGK